MKKSIKFLFFLSVVIPLTFGGCGYHVGSIMHPQVKSIAIAPIKNETMVPLTSAVMRQALSEQFMFDGSLKVKSLEEADCILYGKIIEVSTTATAQDTSNNQKIYRAAEWGVRVTFEFVVIVPGKKKPLIPKREVSGEAKYQVMTDYLVTRRLGIQQACRSVATHTVEYVTEAW